MAGNKKYAIGKGLQAAGGEANAGRAGAALIHAGASMMGQQDKTKAMLDNNSRYDLNLTDDDLADLNEMNKDKGVQR